MLSRLRTDHASAVLAFELTNRAYFAATISDRGDEFFEHFPERYDALLAEQQAGLAAVPRPDRPGPFGPGPLQPVATRV